MRPVYLLIKPVSGKCNMRCEYCFYSDEMKHREVQDCGFMKEEVLSAALEKMLRSADGLCSITFQGGEPTLAGISFYETAVAYTKRYNVNQCEIQYHIQTNGYSLNESWCRFFAENHFLVGVSLDGYEELHDKYRKDGNGRGTYQRVMHAIELLKEFGVPFNVLTVVHKETAENVNKVYNFFSRCGYLYQQYIECLDPLGEEPGMREYSLTPDLYRTFLIGMFRKWYKNITGGKYVYNRYFENLLLMMQGKNPECCSMQGRCAGQWTIEADGSVYPCDFYALDEWKLGNIVTDAVKELEKKRKVLKFAEISEYVPKECAQCRWYPLCRNGCRRNCVEAGEMQRGRNYFCEAYKGFFEYAYDGLWEVFVQRNWGRML